jgi:peptide/nickel transport system substrate-binding protein
MMKEGSQGDKLYGEITRQEFLRRAGVAVVGVGLFGLASCDGRDEEAREAGRPKRGGTLIVGASGGSAKDSIDPHLPLSTMDQFRQAQMYEGLARFDADFNFKLVLAEEITLEQPDRMLVRLRPGVEFHDGKPLTVDDVLFSYRRIVTEPKGLGRAGLSILDLKNSKKLDERTVRFFLKKPNVAILDEVAQVFNGIAPVGFDPGKPNGTGPFMFKSFDPGRQSVFDRNPRYWQEDVPYVDSVEINNLTDDTARVNALLGGEVHVIDGLPATQLPAIERQDDLRVVRSPSGQSSTFYMRVDQAPFDDVRVRQAMRLIVDRPQMIQQALGGVGQIGNDVFSIQDPLYNHDLPQREQDIGEARSLLKQAGQEGLEVELLTGPVTPGLLSASQVLAEQAKAADVTINLRQVDVGTLFGDKFLTWGFSVDFWSTRNYLSTVALALVPTSPFNETHWPDDESRTVYTQLYNEAIRTVNTEKRRELIHEMQRLDWERGGYIIWAFDEILDAQSTRISGLQPNKYKPLNGYDLSGLFFV